MLRKLFSLFIITILTFYSAAQSKGQQELETAFTYLEKGEFKLAGEFAAKALKKDSKLADAYYILAVAKSDDGVLESTEELDKAIELGTKIPDAWAQRANIRSFNLDNEGAILDYNIAIRMDPEEWGNYFNRAGTYNMMEEYELSVKDYSTAIEKGGDESMILAGRAESKLKLKDFDGALSDINSGIDKNPDGYSYMTRAEIYAGMGNKGNACLDWRKAATFEELPEEYIAEKIKENCN